MQYVNAACLLFIILFIDGISLHLDPHKVGKGDATLMLTGRNKFLKSPQIHILLQQRDHVWVEGLPVGVGQVVLLGPLVQVALDDGEVLRVVDRLHDEPREGFLVLGVDGGGFEEFGVELRNALLVGLCPEV